MEAYLAIISWPIELLLGVEITGPFVIQLLSRVLHILSAVILVGGLFYIRTILLPAAPRPGGNSPDGNSRSNISQDNIKTCFADRRAIWAKWVGIATLFLLISGIYNVIVIVGQVKDRGEKLPTEYMILLLAKLLLALLVMFISAILAGKTDAADRFRGNMRRWLNIGWLAAMGIIVIAAVMRTLH